MTEENDLKKAMKVALILGAGVLLLGLLGIWSSF